MKRGFPNNIKTVQSSKHLHFLTKKQMVKKGQKIGWGSPPSPIGQCPKGHTLFFRYPFLSPHILEKMLEIAFAKIYLYP